MPNEPTATPEPSIVDGGTPTEEEARLAAQIDTIGENPTEEPAAAPAPASDAAAAATAAPAAGAEGGEAAAAVAADDDAGAAAASAAAEATPAAPAAVATPTPAPAVATPPVEPIGEPPKPSMDFEAEYQKNQDAFDNGEVEAGEFQKRLREISREESAFNARTEIYKDRVQTAQQRAASEFSNAAAAWEAENKDFMANPLWADSMQKAIELIDKRTPGLPPAELLKAAEQAAFQATGYSRPTPPNTADEAAAKAAALAAAKKDRKPAAVPATLGATPTAAHVDASAGSAYSNLDSLDIDALENQIAHMRPDDIEKYLADAPGANATGQ